jgi:hypothetical protein
MRRTLIAALFLLPTTLAYAQDDTEALMAGLDQVLYCATTYAVLSVHPDAPEGAAAKYDAASTDLFEFAYLAMSEAGMDETAIDELTDPYTEEVTLDLQNDGDMRFTEAQCQEAHDASMIE